MQSLTALDVDKHHKLSVSATAALDYFKTNHLIYFRVDEVSRACCDLPILLASIPSLGGWSLSAITSFEPGRNLFIDNGEWQASHTPSEFKTYPFALIKANEDDKEYSIGFDETSNAVTEDGDDVLYDSNQHPSEFLVNLKKRLDAQFTSDFYTYQFCRKLEELDLIKPINISIHYADDKVNVIRGLHTIDEDKLHALPIETIEELKNNGYLPVMYAILLSLFQFNRLIRLHNKDGDVLITKINMDVATNNTAESTEN